MRGTSTPPTHPWPRPQATCQTSRCFYSILLFLPLLLFALLPSSSEPIDPCANSTLSHSQYIDGVPYCYLYNLTLVSNTSQEIRSTLSASVITLTNVRLTVLNVTNPAYPFLNEIQLYMALISRLTLVNTTLHAPYIWVYSGGSINIDNSSHLSADGFAPSGLPTNSLPEQSNLTAGVAGGGGGGGGIGGVGCFESSARGGAATGDPVTPPDPQSQLDCGGPGSVAANGSTGGDLEGFGFGGGFVQIQILGKDGDLLLAGAITANGTDATHPTLPAGGGAGGFVALLVPNGRIVGADDGKVEANGGAGANNGGGGAGGRIYIDGGVNSYNVRAYGGRSGNGCQAGGQGTIYIVTHNRTLNTAFVELRCVGQESTSVSLVAATDFSNSSTVDRLGLTYCNLLASPTVVIKQQLSMIASRLQPNGAAGSSGGRKLHISVPFLETSSDSSIEADRVQLEVDELKLGSGATDKDVITFTAECTINASRSIDIWGTVAAVRSDSWQPPSSSTRATLSAFSATPPILTLSAAYITLWQGSRLDGDSVPAVVQIAASQELQLLGTVEAMYQRPEGNCSDVLTNIRPNDTCALLPQTFLSSQSNGTAWSSVSITAGELTIGGTLLGSVLVVCSDTDATVLGRIDTVGNGCSSGMGVGAGTAPTANPGGGGGHGGAGGVGVPGGSGAGAEYDKGNWPVQVGSGGSAGTGGGVGGAGGGFIYLSAGLLSFGSGASILSDGNDGASDKGSGGGSGGSVLLHIAAVNAPANLSTRPIVAARGGKGSSASNTAASASAGGGGGGRIYIQWAQAPYLDQTNDVSFIVDPGTGLELVNWGKAGTVVADPPCPPGFSGVLCVGCARGQYKNASGAGDCVPCEGGHHANTTNSTWCETCGAGYYAEAGSPQCLSCPDNYFSVAGQTNCTQCRAGEEANDRHTNCTQCEIGTYKPDNNTRCVDCPAGRYSNDNRTDCLQCPDLPSHAHYVVLQGSKCQYQCDVGFLLPDCLTPFNAMVQSIGGWVVFVGLMALSVAVTFVPFLCCFIRSKRRQRERELLEMDDAETESESDSLPPSPPTAQRLPSAVAVGYDRTQLGASLLEPSTHQSLQDLPSTSLQPRHYPHHLHRIFLSGDNCWQRPLRLSRRVPSEVTPLVFEDEYSVFATDVSKRGRWSGWEQAVHVLLIVFCLPLAASWTRWRRSVHARAVWLYVLNYDHSMLRNAKSRALASSLLFGCSSCHTLAWIDVLANHSEERDAKQTGLPRLPLTLIAAGDGSYHTPFHFDVSDAYNKAVAEYVGVNYFKFLRAVNAALRPIRRTQLSHERSVRQLMAFLNVENHMGIGIGKHLPLGGVKVELGWVGPDANVGGGMLPALIVTAKEELASVASTTSGVREERVAVGVTLSSGGSEFSSRVPQPRFSRTDFLSTRPPPFRRDDRSPQSSDSGRDTQLLSQSYNSAHSYLTSDEEGEEGSQPSIMERALGQEGRKKVEAYLNAKQRMEAEQRRLQQKKSTSYASLPPPSSQQHASDGSGYHAFGAPEGSGWGRGSEAVGAKRKKKQRDGIHEAEIVFGERKEDDEPSSLLDTTSSSIADTVPSQPLPYSASVYHFQPSRSSSTSATPTRRRYSLSLNSPAFKTHITSSLSTSLSITAPPPSPSVPIVYRLQPLALFNLPLYLSRTWLACLFLLLVLIRCGLSLVWSSSSYQLVRWLFWCSLALYPAVPIVMPLLGLAVLVSSSVHCCRLFACCVLLSLVNDSVVVAGSAYSFNVQLGVIDALLLPTLAIINSLMLLLTAHAYVAHLEVLKDLVKGRRDYNNRDREGEEGFISNSPQSSRRSSRRSSLDDRTAPGKRSRHSSRDKRYTHSRRTTAATIVAAMEPQSSNSPFTPSSEPSTPVQTVHLRHDVAALTSPDTPRAEATSEPLPIPFPPPTVSFTPPRGALTPILSVGASTPLSAAATMPSPTSQISMLSQSLAAQHGAPLAALDTPPTTNPPAQSEDGSGDSSAPVSASATPSPSSSSSTHRGPPLSTNPARASAGLPPAPRSAAAGGRAVRGISTAAGRGGARGASSASASPRVSPRTSTTSTPRGSATPSPRGKVKRAAAKKP